MTQTDVQPATADAASGGLAAARGSAEPGRYLTFVLGGEVYALGLLDITEIMEYRPLTVVPMMPSFIRGVINLRGRVVPVVDMAARFGRGNTTVARRTSIIIVEAAGYAAAIGDDGGSPHIGIMVDAVNKVVHLGADDIEPAPAFGAGIRADFISGMAKWDDEFMIVLDANRVLSLHEMSALGRAHVHASATAAAERSDPARALVDPAEATGDAAHS